MTTLEIPPAEVASRAAERLTYVNRTTGETCIAEVEHDGLIHATPEAFDRTLRSAGFELLKAVGRPGAAPRGPMLDPSAAAIVRERDDALAALGVSRINRDLLETDARALADAAGVWADDFERQVRRLGYAPSPEESRLIVAVAEWRARFA